MNLPAIVVVSFVALIGCNPQRNLRRMGNGFANVVGRGPAPVKVDLAALANVAIDATAAQAKGKARQQIADATAEPPPRPAPVHDTGSQPVQTVPPPEPVTVDYTRTVDTSGDVIWKNFHRDGEKPRCEKYTGELSACSGECTELMRVEGMRQLDPRAGKPLTCMCTQGYSNCK